MLSYIKKMLILPHNGMKGIIYEICDTREMRENVKYNGELDQFEIPISVLHENEKYFCNVCYGNLLNCLHDISSYDNVIEGTPIHYHVYNNNNLCFSI